MYEYYHILVKELYKLYYINHILLSYERTINRYPCQPDLKLPVITVTEVYLRRLCLNTSSP